MWNVITEIPAAIKYGVTFVAGFFTAAGTVIGFVRGPLNDHEERISDLEAGNRIMVCWVRAQINETDPQVCLFQENGDGS